MGISNGKIEASEFAIMNNDSVKHPSHYTAGKIMHRSHQRIHVKGGIPRVSEGPGHEIHMAVSA